MLIKGSTTAFVSYLSYEGSLETDSSQGFLSPFLAFAWQEEIERSYHSPMNFSFAAVARNDINLMNVIPKEPVFGD